MHLTLGTIYTFGGCQRRPLYGLQTRGRRHEFVGNLLCIQQYNWYLLELDISMYRYWIVHFPLPLPVTRGGGVVDATPTFCPLVIAGQ